MFDGVIYLQAERGIDAGYEKHRAVSKRVGLQFLKAIKRALDLIANDPMRYPHFDSRHRYVLVKKYHYIVAYRMIGDVLCIIAVDDARRSKRFWKRRLR